MADSEAIPIPLTMPAAEWMALAQFTKRVDHDTVARFAAPCTTYGGRAECDVMWSSVGMLRAALAQAGFAPR